MVVVAFHTARQKEELNFAAYPKLRRQPELARACEGGRAGGCRRMPRSLHIFFGGASCAAIGIHRLGAWGVGATILQGSGFWAA